MSNLWIPALTLAMNNRLAGDATLVALLGANAAANIRVTYAPQAGDPPGTTYPLIQIWPMSDTNDDTFDDRRRPMLFGIRIHVAKRTTTSGYLPLDTMTLIHERVVGDWPDRVDRVPTYGLDRWKPVLTGGTGIAATTYESDLMTDTGFNCVSDDEDTILRWDVTVTAALQKSRPTS